MGVARVDQIRVYIIGDDNQLMALGDAQHFQQFCAAPYATNRIMRCTQQENFGFWRQRLELRKIHLVSIANFLQWVEQQRSLRIGGNVKKWVVYRWLNNYAVTRLRERHATGVQR